MFRKWSGAIVVQVLVFALFLGSAMAQSRRAGQNWACLTI